ncbi:hypothetical protein ABI59_19940 [Acidobacteria bacterium Mor1]|nr:hypothetical protein ABI59_19940 [Acidobacteria bacterium Mor1]
MRHDRRPSPVFRLLALTILAAFPLLAFAADVPTGCLPDPFGQDSDGDGVDDECDRCPGHNDNLDSDLDSVPDGCDVCPGGYDRDDGDGDGVPDACDACPGDDFADYDGDGIADGCDPCPGGHQTEQPGYCDHPMLFFTADEVPELQAKIADPNTVPGALFALIVERADVLSDPANTEYAPVSATDFPNDSTPNAYGRRLRQLAFAYRMAEGNEGAYPNRSRYLDRALEYLDAMLWDYGDWLDGANCNLTRNALARGMATAYDWLFDELKALDDADPSLNRLGEIRWKLRKEMGDGTDATPQCDGSSNSGEFARLSDPIPSNRPWYWNRPWQNHNQQALSAVATAGYAIRREDPRAQAWIDFAKSEYAQQTQDLSGDGSGEYLMPPDGSWHEGIPYYHVMAEAAVPLSVLIQQQDGDPYPTTPFHLEGPTFLAHTTLPDLVGTFRYGDIFPNITRAFIPGVTALLAAAGSEHQNPQAQRLLEEIVLPSSGEPSILAPFQADPLVVIDYDTSVPADSLRCLDTEAEFSDLGVVTLRNRWTDGGSGCEGPEPAGDHYLAFKSGWPGGANAGGLADPAAGRGMNNGHDHADAGSFVYYDNGDVLLQDYPAKNCLEPRKLCGLTAAEAGFECTEWHNTITLRDASGSYGQHHPECLRQPESDRAAANNCDPVDVDAAWASFQAAQPGQLVSDFTNAEYKHIVAESGFLYDADAAVSKFERQIVFTDEYFVVYDRIETPNDVDWNFHTPGSAIHDELNGLVDYTSGATTLRQEILLPQTVSINSSTWSIPACDCADSCSFLQAMTEPDTHVVVSTDNMGQVVEHLSLFISSGSGAGASKHRFQSQPTNWKLVVRKSDGSRDVLKFRKSDGLFSYRKR